jgi:hypothetical protein
MKYLNLLSFVFYFIVNLLNPSNGNLNGNIKYGILSRSLFKDRKYSASLKGKKNHIISKAKKTKYFFECALAGAISCSFTHCVIIPLDVIKTKIQAHKHLASMNLFAAINHMLKNDGPKSLVRGNHPFT